jgi:hypothetical protein
MFGADQFHPSVEGYRAAAAAVLPSALAALGLPTGPEPAGAVQSLGAAAVAAAEQPGTEVSGDDVPTRTRARSRLRRLVPRRTAAPANAPDAVPSLSSQPQWEST